MVLNHNEESVIPWDATLSSMQEHRDLENRYLIYSQPSLAYGAYHQHQQVQLGAPANSSSVGQIQFQDQQSFFYPARQVAGGGGEQQSSSAPSGLSAAAAAAVAAFSQLSQIAGTMDAAEKVMAGLQTGVPGFGTLPGIGQVPGALAYGQLNPQIRQSPFMGSRGRRRDLPFKRGGRGVRGRGRGRGTGNPRMLSSSLHEPEAFSGKNENADKEETGALVEAAKVPGEASRNQQQSRPWCELCHVECTSLQMLEQHYSGKRHKKNLEKAPLQSQTELTQEGFQQNEITVDGENRNPVAVDALAGSEVSSTLENPVFLILEPEAFAYENESAVTEETRAAAEPAKVPGKALKNQQSSRAWCELCRVECTSFQMLEQHYNGKRHKKNLEKAPLQSQTELTREGFQQNEITLDGKNLELVAIGTFAGSEVSSRLENPVFPIASSENLLEGKPPESSGPREKRKMKAVGIGNKRIKSAEPGKPKVVIPLVCDLCNIRCDTKEVLDRHISGKKHIAKLKRFEDHKARYGPVSLQALCPPNPITGITLHSQCHQQPTFGNTPQSTTVATSQPFQGAATATFPGMNSNIQHHWY